MMERKICNNKRSTFPNIFLEVGKAILFLLFVNSALLINAQGGLMISPGTRVVSTLSPQIIITNGKWENSGTFNAATSTVKIEGNASTANSTIGGASSTTFFHLTQEKAANDILLQQNIGVDGNFSMNGGLFELNNFIVTLGTASGQILNESETNRITGITGGEIVKTMTLNGPVNNNPGNLGALIVTPANLGSTTIRRGHVQQADANNGISIFRYYDIIPTIASGWTATLRQHYFDAELGPLPEAQLEHYNSITAGGTQWYARGFTSRNTASNFVENTGYPDFTRRWTLASPLTRPLPILFLDEGIQCNDDEAKLYWIVEESSTSDHFEIEGSSNEVDWQGLSNGNIPSRGAGRNRYEFGLEEYARYVRIKQVEVDGSNQMGETQRLFCDIGSEWTIWPNPTSSNLNLKAPNGKKIKTVEIINMLGQVVWKRDYNGQNIELVNLKLAGKLPAAIYTVKATPSSGGTFIQKIQLKR